MESVDSRTHQSLRTTSSSFKLAAAARRRRVEIRRFRLIANSNPVSAFTEPVLKKHQNGEHMEQNGWYHNHPHQYMKDGKSTGSVELDRSSSNGQLSDLVSSSSSSGTLGSETGSTITDEMNPIEQNECHQEEQHTTEQGLSLDCDAKDGCPPHSAVFICGRRREMEDAVAVVPSFMSVPCGTIGGCDCSTQGSSKTSESRVSALHFFAVYDGHGGLQVASYCKDNLHRALEEEFNKLLQTTPPEQLERELHKALVASFVKIDDQVGGFWQSQPGTSNLSSPNFVAPETVGSTAVVAVVGANRIFVANCGDSRAVLSRGGRAIPLSRDHKFLTSYSQMTLTS